VSIKRQERGRVPGRLKICGGILIYGKSELKLLYSRIEIYGIFIGIPEIGWEGFLFFRTKIWT
jgi:hypothetical protein